MADTTIGQLDPADVINDTDLFLVEQNGRGKRLTGEQITGYITRNVVDVNAEIVAPDVLRQEYSDYNNGDLTLYIPHGPGVVIAEAGKRAATPEEIADLSGQIKTYNLTSKPVYEYEDGQGYVLKPGVPVGSIDVYNGTDGAGQVNKVMGISPTGTERDVLKSELMEFIHPVGSIYMTQLPISPASKFGGTWVLVPDRFLMAAGASHAVDVTGGAETKSVSVEGQADVGLYNFTYQGTTRAYVQINSKSASGTSLKFNTPTEYARYEQSATFGYTGSEESTAAHVSASGSVNVLPPYRTVYVWLRTDSAYDYTGEGVANHYVANSAASGVNPFTFAAATMYDTILISCSAGDKFVISGTDGATAHKLYAFYAADGTRKQVASNTTVSGRTLTAPAEADFLIVNYNHDSTFSLVGTV